MILWTLRVKIKHLLEQLSLCRLILQIACVLQKFEKCSTFLIVDEFHRTGKTFQFKHAIISQMYYINDCLHVSLICMYIS